MEQIIAFVSLFLGLVLGPQRVEVLVGEQVAWVEIHLDGERRALTGPPWSLEVDFGRALEPHRLEAVAFAADGRELGRAEQWLNVARPPAEARLVLEPGEQGRGAAARLTWTSLSGGDPEAVKITFDGRDLIVADPRAFELPAFDPEQLHLLRVELDFRDQVSALAEVTFGGFFADRVSAELTAFAVELEGRKAPALEELAPWLRLDRVPASEGDESGNDESKVRAVSLEKARADIVVVRDQSALAPLARIVQRYLAAPRDRTALASGMSNADRLRGELGLDQGTSLHFLWPHPVIRGSEGQEYRLFPPSQEYGARAGGLVWLLAHERQLSYPLEEQQLADALAVAGMDAARRNRRRAVVLLLGEEPRDRSQSAPEQVEHYLSSIGVPLYVWSLGPPGSADAWQRPEYLASVVDLRRVGRELERRLERQRILWIDGRHLPQSLVVAEAATIERAR